MIPLSPRLLCCASMVQGDYACDIGTDHALLPIYLIKSNRCVQVLATDIKEGPLSAAQKGISRYGVQNAVKLCLSDGFDKVPNKGITDAIIAGMGGETIRDILSAPSAKWLERGTNLVLQPMTRSEVLRVWLAEHGFTVTKETAVKDVHLYTVMQAHYSGECRTLSEVESHIGKLSRTEPLTRIYLATILERLHTKLLGLQQGDNAEEAQNVQIVIDGINQWLQGGKRT